jgi:hypothetical protein
MAVRISSVAARTGWLYPQRQLLSSNQGSCKLLPLHRCAVQQLTALQSHVASRSTHQAWLYVCADGGVYLV